MTSRHLWTGYSPWLSGFTVFMLLLVTAIFGCGTVSYKYGGTDSDRQAARDRCHKEGRGDSPDFERCMEDQGWTVKQFGPSAARSDAKQSVPAERASAAAQSSPAAGDVAPSSKPGHAPSVEHAIVAQSWFKLGGTADGLEAAKKRCAAKLHAADRLEPESHIVTGDMLDCLRDEGWRPLESH